MAQLMHHDPRLPGSNKDALEELPATIKWRPILSTLDILASLEEGDTQNSEYLNQNTSGSPACHDRSVQAVLAPWRALVQMTSRSRRPHHSCHRALVQEAVRRSQGTASHHIGRRGQENLGPYPRHHGRALPARIAAFGACQNDDRTPGRNAMCWSRIQACSACISHHHWLPSGQGLALCLLFYIQLLWWWCALDAQ